MTDKVIMYVVYLAVSIALTVWVGRTFFRNGKVFLEDAFADERLAGSVNHLLVVGFYLLNLGYVSVAMRDSSTVDQASVGDRAAVDEGRPGPARAGRGSLRQPVCAQPLPPHPPAGRVGVPPLPPSGLIVSQPMNPAQAQVYAQQVQAAQAARRRNSPRRAAAEQAVTGRPGCQGADDVRRTASFQADTGLAGTGQPSRR